MVFLHLSLFSFRLNDPRMRFAHEGVGKQINILPKVTLSK